MAAPTITQLPTPPNMQNDAGTFAEKADAFLGALPVFGSEMNSAAQFVDQQSTAAEAARAAAANSAEAASGSATSAGASAATATQQRKQAEIAAAAARSAVGMPSLTGNGSKRLAVNAAGTGVEWAPGGRQDVFTTSGTFVKEADDTAYIIELWGGGASGACNTSSGYAGGGSGGEYVRAVLPAPAVPASVAVTVGNGGAPVAANGHGDPGGATSFGALLSALGGNPGQYNNALIAAIPRASTVSLSSSLLSYLQALPATQAGFGSYGATVPGGSCVDGGAGGGGAYSTSQGVGGTSARAGKGGDGNAALNTQAQDGGIPAGGGGGSSRGGSSGAGGRGEARITRIKA